MPVSIQSVLRITLVIMSFGYLSACSVELKDKDETPEAPVKIQSSGIFPLFKLQGPYFQVQSGERPNAYKLQIEPPEGTIATERTEQAGMANIRSWSMAFPFIDPSVEPGKSYEYRFIGEARIEIARVSVTLPIDLAVDGAVDFTKAKAGAGTDSLRRYRRIFLGPNAILITGSQDVEIQAEQLFSSMGAKIISFEAGLTAAMGVKARSGGQLRLVVQEPMGLLQIEMRGENGGPGLAGASYTERAAQGWSPEIQKHSHCDHVGVGGPGQPGQNGRRGWPGGDGGHTGSFELVTDAGAVFKLEQIFEPGKPGAGGEGGPGQQGGLGGLSEVRTFMTLEMRGPDSAGPIRRNIEKCPVPANGSEGKPGEKGAQGPEGQPGREGLFCRRGFAESCAR